MIFFSLFYLPRGISNFFILRHLANGEIADNHTKDATGVLFWPNKSRLYLWSFYTFFPPFVVISSWFVKLVLFLLNLIKSWSRYLFLIALLAWNKRQTYTEHFYLNFCILNFRVIHDKWQQNIKANQRKNWILNHVKTTSWT